LAVRRNGSPKRLCIDVEGRRGLQLPVDPGEQERAFVQRATVEARQAFECRPVAGVAVADQDRARELELERF
jgi:hypothetical protein